MWKVYDYQFFIKIILTQVKNTNKTLARKQHNKKRIPRL